MRYLHKFTIKDLKKKMVAVSGPRQSGKTTFAKAVLKSFSPSEYLSWDNSEDRKRILKTDWTETSQLIVLDEIHKYSRWKNWIKGIFDKNPEKIRFLFTGSARLDVFRKGGDSLFGRYHLWRLHPFCLAEHPLNISNEKALKRLLDFGGFPEVYIEGDTTQAKRWRRQRRDLILREDVRDLENVKDIKLLDLMLDLLASRV
ncbi:MAG TPA: AAA family ATPase, partial [Pseudobdellovibrionaceae bacterium]|nr:AAA family ATPase [Pseudobdellovibrionaceae bacterium]